ncbi:hypothetical protein AVEN_141774-1, partial [Araneus ventricosus]
MYENLLAVEYERAMILQNKILTESDASRPTSSARSTRWTSPIHTSADESVQDSFQVVNLKKNKKIYGSVPQSDISKKKIKVLPLEQKNKCDSLSSEESLDSEDDSVNMLVDDALRDASKHPAPTTTPKKNSQPASPEKVPYSQAPSESRKPKVPPIVINDKLKTTPLL